MPVRDYIKWGNEVHRGDKGRGKIGVYPKITETATTAEVSIQVWYISDYSTSDSNNSFYFDDYENVYENTAYSAKSYRGSVTINTTGSSGSKWNFDYYARLIYTYPSFTINKTKTVQLRSCTAKLTGVDWVGPSNEMTVEAKYTIPALAKYTITYRDNGYDTGGTLPAQQTKYYGETIPIAQYPTHNGNGYDCVYWATAVTDGTVAYRAGTSYSGNASLILYACWAPKKYTVTYDPNGGTSGTVVSQVKTFGEPLTISTTATPIRDNYNFLGWSITSDSAVADFVPGGPYSEEGDMTLYAVWELAYIPPIISNVIVERCDAEGTHSDDGTYFDISFDWATDEMSEALGMAAYIRAWAPDGTPVVDQTFDIGMFSSFIGHFSLSDFGLAALGGGYIDADYNYTVSVMVMDSSYETGSVQRTLRSVAYPIDILAEGKGIAFGKPASKEGKFDVNFDVIFNKSIEFSEAAKRALLDMFYPVNSIYISYSETSPADLFGGTWVRILDRFLFGTAPDGAYKLGDEDGESQHYLTEAEMPKHVHADIFYQTPGDINKKLTLNSGTTGYNLGWTANAGNGTNNELKTGYAGGGNQQVGLGEAHNNMPPFVAVAIWRRTA